MIRRATAIAATVAFGSAVCFAGRANAGVGVSDSAPAPAVREERAVERWNAKVLDASLWWGVTPAVAEVRLYVEGIRYHYPDQNIDRWYWDVREAGWPDKAWPWVAHVMNGESGGNPYSTSKDRDIGLLQVNWKSWHGAGDRLGLPWWTWADVPQAGLRMALYVYGVQGRGAWVADRSRFPEPDLSQDEASLLFIYAQEHLSLFA